MGKNNFFYFFGTGIKMAAAIAQEQNMEVAPATKKVPMSVQDVVD